MMRTLTVHYQWEDDMVRERTGHPSLFAKAKKVMLLTLHTIAASGLAFKENCSSST